MKSVDSETVLIGVDCAAQERNTGLARGQFANGRVVVLEQCMGGQDRSVAETITSWIHDYPSALIALDAPLGWPLALGENLISHCAGESVSRDPHEMFRRYTDAVVRATLNKQPFDVGANLIARVSRVALNMLQDVREMSGRPIQLAWSPEIGRTTQAIEVYPAATMKSRGIVVRNPKKTQEGRQQVVEALSTCIDFSAVLPGVLACADRIDACICLLAASDFLNGLTVAPDDVERAKREGWIWFKQPAGAIGRLKHED